MYFNINNYLNLLADFANGGSIGKRSVELKGIFDQIGQSLQDALYPIVNQAVQDLALQITQQLGNLIFILIKNNKIVF